MDDPDQSFIRTYPDIQRLRENAAHDDWRDWRKPVISMVKAGVQLERAVIELQAERELWAKQSAQDRLRIRVEALEAAQRETKNIRKQVLSFFWKLGALVLAAWLGHIWK